MSKKLQLSIPKPCHENWDNMTPVQQGKFCGSCQKQVVDFSNMSDRQVAEFFKKPILNLSKGGSVCGRFMTDQLERNIEIPKKRIPWLRYFFQFVIPAFLISIKASAQKTQGQINVKITAKDTTKKAVVFSDQRITLGVIARPVYNQPLKGDIKVTPVKKTVMDKTIRTDTVQLPEVVISCNRELRMGKVLNYQIVKVETSVIKGKVVDEKGNPIPYASVVIKGTRNGVSTNENGSFSLTPGAGWNTITLVGSYVGFDVTDLLVDKKTSSGSIIIQLRPSRSMMVGELVVCGKPPTKKELKQAPLMPDITDDKHTATFKVFPNPVGSGSSLNLEINKTEEGYYSLQLLNQSGQSVHQQDIWIDADARLLNIDVPSVAAGTYFLALTNKRSGKRSTEKIVIQ